MKRLFLFLFLAVCFAGGTTQAVDNKCNTAAKVVAKTIAGLFLLNQCVDGVLSGSPIRAVFAPLDLLASIAFLFSATNDIEICITPKTGKSNPGRV